MSRKYRSIQTACLVLLAIAVRCSTVPDFACGAEESIGWQAAGSQGAVSAGGADAVAAGIEILQNGGNAADAAVATILALSVVESNQFCFGGEVPILVYDATRNVVEVVAGMGTAPELANREFFEAHGGIPGSGILPAAVPAACDACITTLERYGTLRLADVAAPSLRILDHGEKDWHPLLAATLRQLIDAEAQSDDRLRGLRLAADCFYRGPIAREIADWSAANGGLIRSPISRGTSRASKSRPPPAIAAGRSANADPGRRARTCCRH